MPGSMELVVCLECSFGRICDRIALCLHMLALDAGQVVLESCLMEKNPSSLNAKIASDPEKRNPV